MIELVLGAMAVSAMLCVVPRAIADAIATTRAAKAGKWRVVERQQQRRIAARDRLVRVWAERRSQRHRAAGGDGQWRPGARAYVSDLYYGWWEDRLAHRQARRAARPPFDPDRPPWHARLDEAIMRRVRSRRGDAPPVVEPSQPSPPPPPASDLPETPPPPSTWTFDDDGERLQPTPDEPETPNHEVLDPWQYSEPIKNEEKADMHPVQAATAVAGEAYGVVSGATQAAGIRLAFAALHAATASEIGRLQQSVARLEASAVSMEMDAATMAAIDRVREALASLQAAVTGVAEEVDGAMHAVQTRFALHLPGVELNATVGGLANRRAYRGD